MQTVTQGALHLAAQMTGSKEQAMDIMQTALLKSLEKKNAPAPQEPGYRSWFYSVVRNQSIDWLRHNKRFVHEDSVDQQKSQTDAPDQLLELQQRNRLLHDALENLSSEQREIIYLKDFHELSYAEIADVLGIEAGTVMSRLHRARQALRKTLN